MLLAMRETSLHASTYRVEFSPAARRRDSPVSSSNEDEVGDEQVEGHCAHGEAEEDDEQSGPQFAAG